MLTYHCYFFFWSFLCLFLQQVTFSYNNDQFYIKLPNGTMMSFPNRFGDDSFKHIDVQGDVKVQGIKLK